MAVAVSVGVEVGSAVGDGIGVSVTAWVDDEPISKNDNSARVATADFRLFTRQA